MNNPWKVLGVNRESSPEEIRKAYMDLSWKHHPDCKGGDPIKFAQLSEAHALLKNPAKLKAFIAEKAALCRACSVCKGRGATFKQKGFGARAAVTCKACAGSGFIIKEKEV